MMKKFAYRVLLSFFAMCCFLPSCIDKIDLEIPTGAEDALAIEGRIIKGDPSFVALSVNRLFNFDGESRSNLALRKVTLIDSDNVSLELRSSDNSVYRAEIEEDSPIDVQVGKSYKIRVELFDNRIFESDLEELVATPDIVDLNVAIQEDVETGITGNATTVERVALSVDSDLSGLENGGLYWDVFNIFKITDSPIRQNIELKTCYVTKPANVNDIYVLDPQSTTEDILRGIPLRVADIDLRFSEGLYYEVRQYALSRSALDYWGAIDFLSERTGNIFDGPVGEVPTNFMNINDPDDPVYGFFFASEEKMARIKVPQNLVGNPEPHCPPNTPATSGPFGSCLWGLCCDCLADPDATTEKPSFWID